MYFEQNILLLLHKIHTENDSTLNKEVNFARNLFEKFV